MARAAPVMLDEIQVGDFAVSNVRAYVIETPSSISVLGFDFLNRLERYEVRGRKLILHW
jgi:clan AA aspartic protease (TIGR02281 family)